MERSFLQRQSIFFYSEKVNEELIILFAVAFTLVFLWMGSL